jgi:hypothetical protein
MGKIKSLYTVFIVLVKAVTHTNMKKIGFAGMCFHKKLGSPIFMNAIPEA